MANKRKGKTSSPVGVEFDQEAFEMDRAKSILIDADKIKSDKPFMRRLKSHNKKMDKVLDKAMGM